jgi:hypothetical protein
MQDAIKRFTKTITLDKLSWIIIAFGILVRVAQYLWNRSLWADEAVLALNIVNRNYLQLFQPLDYDQGAPVGFLLLEKLAVQILGDNEYALRLFPLLSGIASLFLFYKLAKRFILPSAVPIALALFASLHYLVYYASEVKQYSSDVAIALLCCFICLQLSHPNLAPSRIITVAVAGAIAIWFSHPAILVLAGVSASVICLKFVKKEPLNIIPLAIIFSTWLISFVGFYLFSVQSLSSDEDLLTSWRSAFPAFPLDILWYLDAFGKFFYRPLGFNGPMDGLAIAIFVVGCIAYFYRNKPGLFIVLSPLFAAFLAAGLQKYPFRSRLVLFLAPFIILIIAEGADYIRRKFRSKPATFISIILISLLLFPPLASASQLLIKPNLRGEIKPVISHVKTHQQPGDVLYIYQRGKYQFQYYAEKYGYRDGDYIIGVEDLDKYDGRSLSKAELQRYQKDLDKLRGNKRVWLLFAHANVRSENEKIKDYLDKIGQQTDFFEATGAFVYLYDLSGSKNPS